MSALLSGIITAQTRASKVFAPSYPRYSAKMNGIRYITANETVLNGNFEIELTWERKDYSGTEFTRLLGNTVNDVTQDRLIAWDSNHPTNSNVLTLFGDNNEVNAKAFNFFDGVAQGQVVTIKVTLNDNQIDFYLDGELKSTIFDDDARIVPFSITEIGAALGGGNASRGIISGVKITDHSKLPKGTYLSDQAGTYTEVSIPVVKGDVLTFDYFYRADTDSQIIFSTINRNNPFAVNVNGIITFSTIFNSEVKVNGDVVVDSTFQMVEGETYAIQTTINEISTITRIGGTNTGEEQTEGVIANFSLNGGEYLYAFNNVIDNGDNTGIAPQTGSVTQFGSELWDGSWDKTFNADIAISNGIVTISNNTTSTITYVGGQSSYPSEAGKVYRVTGTLLSRTSGLVFLRINGSQKLELADGVPFTYYFIAGSNSTDVDFKCFGNEFQFFTISDDVSFKETTNGFIPSFDPLIDQYTAESNTVYWPIDESEGVDVLAYDENGNRWERDLWREQGLRYGTGISRLGMNDYEFDDTPQFQGIFNDIESLPDGTEVDLTYEIYDYVQGSIDVFIRSDSEQALSTNRSANGIYTESITVSGAANGSPLRVSIRSDNPINTTCKVRNVSMIVKKDGVFTPDAEREFQSTFIGEGSVLVKDSVDAPTQYFNGVPCDRNGVLAVDSVGALVVKQVSALPMTVNGRIAVVTDSAVERIGSGATPINQGRLVLGTGSPTRYSSGVPYTADSQIAVILK